MLLNKRCGTEMLMKLTELSSLLKTVVTAGAVKALAANAPHKDRINKAEAYRTYGRAQVDRWLREGLIQLSSDHSAISKKTFDRKKLEAVAESSNRCTYLPVAER